MALKVSIRIENSNKKSMKINRAQKTKAKSPKLEWIKIADKNHFMAALGRDGHCAVTLWVAITRAFPSNLNFYCRCLAVGLKRLQNHYSIEINHFHTFPYPFYSAPFFRPLKGRCNRLGGKWGKGESIFPFDFNFQLASSWFNFVISSSPYFKGFLSLFSLSWQSPAKCGGGSHQVACYCFLRGAWIPPVTPKPVSEPRGHWLDIPDPDPGWSPVQLW